MDIMAFSLRPPGYLQTKSMHLKGKICKATSKDFALRIKAKRNHQVLAKVCYRPAHRAWNEGRAGKTFWPCKSTVRWRVTSVQVLVGTEQNEDS